MHITTDFISNILYIYLSKSLIWLQFDLLLYFHIFHLCDWVCGNIRPKPWQRSGPKHWRRRRNGVMAAASMTSHVTKS